MKTPFKFLIFALSFLILGLANVAAVSVYGEFSNGGSNIETSNSSSVYFDADVFSMTPNINIHIGLYNSAGTEVQNFYDNEEYASNNFYQRFTLTRLDDGVYNIIIQAQDADEDASSAMLTLRISKADVPVLKHIGDLSMVVKEKIIITPEATDADGSTMTYSISSPDVDSADYNWDGTTFSWKADHIGTYTFTVTASNGNYSDTETFNILVKQIEHVLIIKSFNLTQTQVSPGDLISATIEIQNDGNVDETNAVLYLKIPSLGISTQTAEFTLDKANTIKKTLQLIIPSTAAEGTYTLTATTVYDSVSRTITVKKNTPVIIDTSSNETVTPVVPQTSGISTEMIIFAEVLIILVVCVIIYASKQRKLKIVNEFA